MHWPGQGEKPRCGRGSPGAAHQSPGAGLPDSPGGLRRRRGSARLTAGVKAWAEQERAGRACGPKAGPRGGPPAGPAPRQQLLLLKLERWLRGFCVSQDQNTPIKRDQEPGQVDCRWERELNLFFFFKQKCKENSGTKCLQVQFFHFSL